MHERLRVRALAMGLVLFLFAPAAHALEPTTVQVRGVAPLEDPAGGDPRQRAFDAALVEAVLEVARVYVAQEALELEMERLEPVLRERAPAFVLTYRRHGPPKRRKTRGGVEEIVVEITATVDAAQVRALLEDEGLLAREADRPSVALRVRGVAAEGSGPAPALLGGFEQYLQQALEGDGYVVVDPALHPSASDDGAVELARQLGADVGIDVAVSWREDPPRDALTRGVAEVRVQARTARDGSTLASARFDAPGYHDAPDEALLRALEALRNQVADNLGLQLARNWQAVARGDGPVQLQLVNVSSFRQVEAVRRVLLRGLGARQADLVEVGPRSAALRVAGKLSAGSLQERLSAERYDGFSLEPVGALAGVVQLRVRSDGDGDQIFP